ncbi:unnamed protein product [Pleuronectes platessa]|uniref:Uncharacterized protein n=1 Tax=Pleuronectes platessa TaxID=8262 RepID=A0A9N7TX36_PLEPL|nr:unnamed protein product [Pleuronectes platessa]
MDFTPANSPPLWKEAGDLTLSKNERRWQEGGEASHFLAFGGFIVEATQGSDRADTTGLPQSPPARSLSIVFSPTHSSPLSYSRRGPHYNFTGYHQTSPHYPERRAEMGLLGAIAHSSSPPACWNAKTSRQGVMVGPLNLHTFACCQTELLLTASRADCLPGPRPNPVGMVTRDGQNVARQARGQNDVSRRGPLRDVFRWTGVISNDLQMSLKTFGTAVRGKLGIKPSDFRLVNHPLYHLSHRRHSAGTFQNNLFGPRFLDIRRQETQNSSRPLIAFSSAVKKVPGKSEKINLMVNQKEIPTVIEFIPKVLDGVGNLPKVKQKPVD